jgi:hypothetical protein
MEHPFRTTRRPQYAREGIAGIGQWEACCQGCGEVVRAETERLLKDLKARHVRQARRPMAKAR